MDAEPHTEGRVAQLPKDGGRLVTEEAGIVFIPVEHEGNARASDEEVDIIEAILNELRDRQLVGDHAGGPRKLFGNDSREFVKDKPLTLIDGANLVFLLEKHGYAVRLDVAAARAAKP